MDLVMCLACGKFVQAFQKDGTFEPRRDECPACGGAEFKHTATETIIGADD